MLGDLPELRLALGQQSAGGDLVREVTQGGDSSGHLTTVAKDRVG